MKKMSLRVDLHYPDTLDDAEFPLPHEGDIIVDVREGITNKLLAAHGPYQPDRVVVTVSEPRR